MRRRRRAPTRRGAVAVLVPALVCSAVSVAAAVADRPASEPSAEAALEPIDGYPQRIGFDRPAPRLPDHPGALAATMTDNDFGAAHDLGVTSRGRLWELPRGVNALSPDGRLLLTSQGQDAQNRAVVHDLATGDVHVYDDIGEPSYDGRPVTIDYSLDRSESVRWSGDGSAVLARLTERRPWRGARAMVLDVASGRLTALPAGAPAGFRSPSQPVVVRWGRDDESGSPVAVTTDLETGDADELSLRPASPWGGSDQPRASISPDGSTLLLVEATRGAGSDVTLRLFSLADGTELPSRHLDDWDGCAPTWLGDDPVVPTRTDVAGSALVTADGSEPLVAVHHRMQSMCLELTPDALSAGPHRSLLGTSTALWTWYWWQLLGLVAIGLLALTALLWAMSSPGARTAPRVTRRSARPRTATAPGPGRRRARPRERSGGDAPARRSGSSPRSARAPRRAAGGGRRARWRRRRSSSSAAGR